MPRYVIFANGEIVNMQRAGSLVRQGDVILCADGGSHHAFALGLQPDMVLGDLDSVQEADRARIQAAQIPVQQYSHDKDQTDLELALHYAAAQAPSAILIIGALGRRLDHTLGNVAMLSDPAFASLDVRLDDGTEEVFFCRQNAAIEGTAGDLVSLVPWGQPAAGVRTAGLKWPLRAETLYPEKTRGISNEMLGSAASVTIDAGLLLIVHRRESRPDNLRSDTERVP